MKDNEPRLTRQQRRELEKKSGLRKPNTTPTISLEESRLRQHSAVIEKEAKRRGIVINKAEEALWDEPIPAPEPSTDPTSLMEAKLSDMLSRMNQSENPHFQAALADLARLREVRGLKSLILLGDSNMVMAAEVALTEDEADIELRLLLSEDGIAQIDHPFNLASIFVHEIEHLRDIEEFDIEIQELPLPERLAQHWERHSNQSVYDAMEVRAHGAQNEAILQHFGMIRAIPEYAPPKQVELVANYVRSLPKTRL